MRYHPEYTVLHSGTHRRPPARIGAPGLCRYVDFWLPNRPNAPDGGESETHPLQNITFTERRQDWIGQIDRFLTDLTKHVSGTIDRSLGGIGTR